MQQGQGGDSEKHLDGAANDNNGWRSWLLIYHKACRPGRVSAGWVDSREFLTEPLKEAAVLPISPDSTDPEVNKRKHEDTKQNIFFIVSSLGHMLIWQRSSWRNCSQQASNRHQGGTRIKQLTIANCFKHCATIMFTCYVYSNVVIWELCFLPMYIYSFIA